MKQYRVELRNHNGLVKTIDVVAITHEQAKMRAERQTNLLVLSTELIA